MIAANDNGIKIKNNFLNCATELTMGVGQAVNYVFQRSKSLWGGVGLATLVEGMSVYAGHPLTNPETLGFAGFVGGLATAMMGCMNFDLNACVSEEQSDRNFDRAAILWGVIGFVIAIPSMDLMLKADQDRQAQASVVITVSTTAQDDATPTRHIVTNKKALSLRN